MGAAEFTGGKVDVVGAAQSQGVQVA